MLQVDDIVQAALRTHQVGRTRATASYRGVLTPLTVEQSGTIQSDGNGQVQSTSAVKVVGVGNSLVPKNRADILSATGQEIALYRDVKLRGDTWWTIPLGVFKITRAGDSLERVRRGRVFDWSVNLTLQDRFESIQADDFLAVDAPVPGNMAWAEIRRLSPVPVQQSLVDVSVPPSTVYDTRIGAITTLIGLLGGEPTLTRSGVLTARLADAWISVTTPAFDITGTITWSDEITNDFYNQVQVKSSSDATLVAFRQNTDDWNPISVGRAGGRTYKASSPIYTTQAMVDAAADTALARLSTRRSRLVTVETTPEGILCELGDVGWVRDTRQGRAVLGEVTSMTIPLEATALPKLTLIVAEEA